MMGGLYVEQLSLFEENSVEESILIPKNILSPLESKEKITSKKFKDRQKVFSNYVHAIQKKYNCSWFEARELFFEHRDREKPITLNVESI